MLLTIDVGNTNTVLAVFDKDEILGKWRFTTNPSRTADEYALNISALMEMKELSLQEIEHVVIASVVPQVVFPLRQFCTSYIECEPLVVGDSKVTLGVDVVIDNPKEAGADRLVNALAAYQLYGGNAIILDFGTATTFDVINDKGDYIGGVIAPGINLSLDALKSAAAKLPEVAIKRPNEVVGKSTVSAMQSGIYWGYLGMIEGIISQIKNSEKIEKVIATGGLTSLFYNETNAIDHVEPDLTIKGLKAVFDLNGMDKK